MSEVIKVELSLPVTVRKHNVDKIGLQTLLRSHKKDNGITNRMLSEKLKRPMTEVEHWFRTDACWSIPDADVWYALKDALYIVTDEYDAQVTEFTEQEGVFEKANRFYFVDGIAPALTVASADEKIIYVEGGGVMADINAVKLGGLWGARQAGSLWDAELIAPTLKTSSGGYSEPLIIDVEPTKGERTLTKSNEVTYDKQPFTYVSLFSGIGGFETALNKLGGTCVLASEIDRFANQSYKALYGHETAGDITKIASEDVPDHDVLVGGFPCQAFSVAGKRLGFEDTRGTLFFEAVRIAKVKRPKALLLENVKGLVGHDGGKTLDTMVAALNEIGYTVDFDVLNSKYFGVPQNRERIFIVAVRDDLATPAPWAIEGNNVVAKGKRRISGYEGVKTFNFDFPTNDTVTTRLRDVLETEVDEKYYLSDDKTAKLVAQLNEGSGLGKDGQLGTVVDGNNVSPCIDASYAKGIGPSDVTKNRNRRPHLLTEGLPIREATTKGYAVATEGDAVNFQFPDSKTRRGRVGKQLANTLEASNINQGVVEDVRRLAQEKRPNDEIGITVKENGDIRPHRMDSRKSGLSELNVNHENNESFTVTSAHAPKVYGDSTRYRIRKLTPLECWRLQGFTDEQHQAVVDAGVSDSQRYKQAGNAVTVNVIEEIGERLLPYLR